MPVILNLIKESLKPVTLGAEGGHAISPVLVFFLSLFPCLSEPIGAQILIQSPVSEKESELISLSVCTSLKQVPSAWKKDTVGFIMLTHHVHLWELNIIKTQ